MHGAGPPRHLPNPNPTQPHGFSPQSELAWGAETPTTPKRGPPAPSSLPSLHEEAPPGGMAGRAGTYAETALPLRISAGAMARPRKHQAELGGARGWSVGRAVPSKTLLLAPRGPKLAAAAGPPARKRCHRPATEEEERGARRLLWVPRFPCDGREVLPVWPPRPFPVPRGPGLRREMAAGTPQGRRCRSLPPLGGVSRRGAGLF